MGSALITDPPENAVGSVADSTTRFVPERPTPIEDLVRALRGVKALESLNEDELRWLAENGVEQLAPDGASVFRGGDPVHEMAIVLRGEIHVRRTSGPVSFFIGRSAHLTGKLPFSRMKSYGGDGYAVGDVWTLKLRRKHLPGGAGRNSEACPVIRLDIAGSRARGNAHGAAGGEAERSW